MSEKTEMNAELRTVTNAEPSAESSAQVSAEANAKSNAQVSADVSAETSAESSTQEESREYTIREVARMFNMEPSTLRYYEDVGLLTNVDRTTSGQRVYRECHINRLKSICCFKHAGMTIDDLKRFFIFEADEQHHIDDMVSLLTDRRNAIEEQRKVLDEAYAHVLRKLHFYGDIRSSIANGTSMPDWKDYRNVIFES